MTQWIKNLPENAGDTGDMSSIPGSERSSGEGNGNPLQYSCLKNSMDREAWKVTVQGHKELDVTECLTLFFHYKIEKMPHISAGTTLFSRVWRVERQEGKGSLYGEKENEIPFNTTYKDVL